ncbi:hypothetical protein V6N13_013939 [Hibiscus sabdariffa]|uniref:Uncharacterized protein n=1 Tax=Hibiscus sabdariffa TaxID=183260 RepID=A0ABR2RUD7_9ROSI
MGVLRSLSFGFVVIHSRERVVLKLAWNKAITSLKVQSDSIEALKLIQEHSITGHYIPCSSHCQYGHEELTIVALLDQPSIVLNSLLHRDVFDPSYCGNSFLLLGTTISQVAEQRRRLIFQLRNYLRLVRRTGGLRIVVLHQWGIIVEDAREMGRVFLQGMYALENGHDDMPLYFDNMSFEELEELEFRYAKHVNELYNARNKKIAGTTNTNEDVAASLSPGAR